MNSVGSVVGLYTFNIRYPAGNWKRPDIRSNPSSRFFMSHKIILSKFWRLKKHPKNSYWLVCMESYAGHNCTPQNELLSFNLQTSTVYLSMYSKENGKLNQFRCDFILSIMLHACSLYFYLVQKYFIHYFSLITIILYCCKK